MTSVHSLLLIAVSLACFLSFSWAVTHHFRRYEAVKSGMRAIGILGLLGYAWTLWLLIQAPVSGALAMLSLLLFMASLIVFWLAISATRDARLTLAYSLDAPTKIVKRGIYRYVRHPFYSAYICFWAGGFSGTLSVVTAFVAALMFLLYFKAAVGEEAKFAGSELADDYRVYQRQTGMFFPLVRRSTTHRRA